MTTCRPKPVEPMSALKNAASFITGAMILYRSDCDCTKCNAIRKDAKALANKLRALAKHSRKRGG